MVKKLSSNASCVAEGHSQNSTYYQYLGAFGGAKFARSRGCGIRELEAVAIVIGVKWLLPPT